MKNLIIIMLFLSPSCFSLKISSPLIGQKDDFVWVGENQGRKFQLELTQSEGYRFYGKMIIKNEDTLFLRGFQKGNNHITGYVNLQDSLALLAYDNDSLNYPREQKLSLNGSVFLWAYGLSGDSIISKNYGQPDTIIPEGLILRKIEKSNQ